MTQPEIRDPDDDITDAMFDDAGDISNRFSLDVVERTALTIMIARLVLAERNRTIDEAAVVALTCGAGATGVAIAEAIRALQ